MEVGVDRVLSISGSISGKTSRAISIAADAVVARKGF